DGQLLTAPRALDQPGDVDPPRHPFGAGSALGGHPDDQRVTLAAATAQRGGADAPAAPAELEGEVQRDPGAGHADGVAERDGPAVDVDLVRVDAELLGRHQPDRGESLVDLDEVQVGGRDALL